jgi:hypothetical protein
MTIAPASEGIDGSMATVVLESFSTVSTLRMLLVLLECYARVWATIFPLEDPEEVQIKTPILAAFISRHLTVCWLTANQSNRGRAEDHIRGKAGQLEVEEEVDVALW